MDYDIVTEPIDRWPLPDTRSRPYPPFTAGYEDTMVLLRRELGALKATGPVVIQVVTRRGGADIRKDGLVRADAKIEHPGVRVAFESKHGPLTYSTDQFDGNYRLPAWQQNLRAIALGLEALRRVDRYGISRSGEQYRGWLAIEGSRTDPAGARQVLLDYAGVALDDEPGNSGFPNVDLLRWARSQTHPDRNGGDRSKWDQVEAAAKLLGLLS